jgi:hypothetical protein
MAASGLEMGQQYVLSELAFRGREQAKTLHPSLTVIPAKAGIQRL